jgi:acyl carrier protein
MPDDSSINERICKLFAEDLYIEVPANDLDLIDEGLLDSLSLVDLLVRLEKEFGITVAMDQLDLDDFRTVQRIGKYIGRMTATTEVSVSPTNGQLKSS